MANKESDYDFLCNNDTRQIKLAIQGDAFFAATIQSETAKKIDLSGGTRNVEGITLAHCLKLTRIIWPKDTGAIKRVAVHSADNLTTLDVSGLTNLEELSIFDCALLETIIGIGKTVRVVNAHGVNLKSLDLSQAKNLEKFNVVTLNATLSVVAKNLPELQYFFLQGNQLKTTLQQCPNLVSLYINSNNNPVDINLSDCSNLVDASILAAEHSSINGLQDCKKVVSHTAVSQRTAELKKLTNDFIAPILQDKPGPEDMETLIQKYGTIRERNHACIIKISLLSTMEKTLTLEPDRLASAKNITTETRSFDEFDPLIFLPELDAETRQTIMQSASRLPITEDIIVAWLKEQENPSNNNQQQNLLVFNKKDLKNQAFFNFLKQLDQKRMQLIYFMGKQHKWPRQPVIAEFHRRLLERGSKFFGGGLAAAPAAPFKAAVIAPAAQRLAGKDKSESKLSDNAKQRKLSNTLMALHALRPLSNAFIRKNSNAQTRRHAARDRLKIAKAKVWQEQQARQRLKMSNVKSSDEYQARNRLNRGNEKGLELDYQSRVGAAAKTYTPIDKQKQFQPGATDAPPKLIDVRDQSPEFLELDEKAKPNLDLSLNQPTAAEMKKHMQDGHPAGADPKLLQINDKNPALENINVQDKPNLNLGMPMSLSESLSEENEHFEKQKVLGQTNDHSPELTDAQDRIKIVLELLDEPAKVDLHLPDSDSPFSTREEEKHVRATLLQIDPVLTPKIGTEGSIISESPHLTDATDRDAATLLLLEFVREIEDLEYSLPPPTLEQPIKLHQQLNPELIDKERAIQDPEDVLPNLIQEQLQEQLAACDLLQFELGYSSETLLLLLQEAKTRISPDNIAAQAAISEIEKSINATLFNVSFTNSINDLDVKSNMLLKAEGELGESLRQLSEVCPPKQSVRTKLIDLLSTMAQQYLEAKPSSGVFGTGFLAGQHKTRYEMLNSWIHVLKSNQSLPLSGFNATLAELYKDKMLKSAFEKPVEEPVVELLRNYVTSGPKPTKRKS